jgi:hypothetical protein
VVIVFSFPVRQGRIDYAAKLVLNEEFTEDAVILDVEGQIVHIDRVCADAGHELPDIRSRLGRALPDVVLGDPDIRLFPDHGPPRTEAS